VNDPSRSDAGWLRVLVHEVRSPVAALAAVSEALARDGLDPVERRDLASLAVAACTSIERLLTDAAMASVQREEVDPARLAKEAVVAAAAAGARVRLVLASEIPSLRADPVRLRQALDNLVENALRHAGAEAEVRVTVAADGPSVLLVVSDKGEGIPREDLARIFEAGVRLAPGRSGSGLGLAIARAIAEAHGGTLDVESAPGEGATFTLRLPLA
jgi:signal transduction histidine kinase